MFKKTIISTCIISMISAQALAQTQNRSQSILDSYMPGGKAIEARGLPQPAAALPASDKYAKSMDLLKQSLPLAGQPVQKDIRPSEGWLYPQEDKKRISLVPTSSFYASHSHRLLNTYLPIANGYAAPKTYQVPYGQDARNYLLHPNADPADPYYKLYFGGQLNSYLGSIYVNRPVRAKRTTDFAYEVIRNHKDHEVKYFPISDNYVIRPLYALAFVGSYYLLYSGFKDRGAYDRIYENRGAVAQPDQGAHNLAGTVVATSGVVASAKNDKEEPAEKSKPTMNHFKIKPPAYSERSDVLKNSGRGDVSKPIEEASEEESVVSGPSSGLRGGGPKRGERPKHFEPKNINVKTRLTAKQSREATAELLKEKQKKQEKQEEQTIGMRRFEVSKEYDRRFEEFKKFEAEKAEQAEREKEYENEEFEEFKEVEKSVNLEEPLFQNLEEPIPEKSEKTDSEVGRKVYRHILEISDRKSSNFYPEEDESSKSDYFGEAPLPRKTPLLQSAASLSLSAFTTWFIGYSESDALNTYNKFMKEEENVNYEE